MESKFDILFEYLRKEMEINKKFDEEEGIDVNDKDYKPDIFTSMSRLKSFINYRAVRTKQDWVSRNTRGNNSVEACRMRNELDKERREKHNAALVSVVDFVKFGERFDLPPIYEGKLLTPQQILEHKSDSYEARMEMTDFLFSIINDIENISMLELRKNKDVKDFLETLKDSVYKIDRDYDVKRGLQKDEGDIVYNEKKEEKYL